MFTGIVEAMGRVRSVVHTNEGCRVTVDAGDLDLSDVRRGDSIAVDGCCLTAVDLANGAFVVDVSSETIDCTAALRAGAAVNLEKALRYTDRLDGHFVTGHVDGVGRVVAVAPDGESRRLQLEVPETLARYIARKGSVTVNGVSLTVNEVSGQTFGVNLIPHTLGVTNLKELVAGDAVNLEVDLIARYLERLLEARGGTATA